MSNASARLPTNPQEWLLLAWRRAWLILLPAVFVGAAGGFVATKLPSVYRASTVILIERAEVPEQYVRSVVTAKIEDRLATINQQILSRTRLETIIRDLDLFREDRDRLPMEALVGRMRGAIDVKVTRSNAFTVYYIGRDPREVRDVTNRIAALYIEENSKFREERASGTSAFLEAQLESVKARLAEQEAHVRQFKERYIGELPQQQEVNLRTLDRLQSHSQSLADQLRAAEDRRILLQVQLSQMPRFNELVTSRPQSLSSGRSGPVPAAPDPLGQRLDQARSDLARLQGRYTEQHPDVIRAARQVEQLEAALATRPAGMESSPVASADAVPPATGDLREVREVPNPAYAQIEAQLAAIDREIAAVRENQTQTGTQIKALERTVEKVPQLEQQYLGVTRDYNNTRAMYESLLAKKLDAELAENLERRQKGEQFRVLDPATLPQTPYKPTRPLIAAFGLTLGFGVGGAAALGLELMKSSLRGTRDVRTLLPTVPLVGVISIIPNRRARRRRRLAQAVVALAVIAIGAATAAGAIRYEQRIVSLPIFERLLR